MLKDTLKLLREQKNLTKKQVADAIEVTERAYITYEYGQRDVSTGTLQKLADFYGVTTDYLLGREPAPDDPVETLSRELKLNLYEKAIVTAYLSMDTKSRTDLVKMVQTVADAVQNGTESKYTYTINVAARGGEPPHTEEMTQEERKRIANLPRVPDDL
ncbi:helix-turn-helix transcriptional regulator [Ruminococcus sp.]|uniref:helix-turn-helix transcriptional regulator n=1 Tax=Ruminococcus sp. TaxID=41978 RepID=UPI002E79C6EB|nr:helix-turn-helix transcriptional regulator [Ruminococcus sp.]MEE1396723.1 helix-turn-helix transcriptional regulator [Ruminococcus sp.]